MGTVSERLAFLITANADGAIRAFEATGKAADRELGRAENKLDKIGVNMTRFGAGALAATGVAAVGLFKLADSAGDAAEATSKANVIFGEGADVVTDYGKKAAEAAGLSETAALNAASTFGTMGKAAGLAGEDLGLFSTDLVGLSADLASFSNTSPEQAVEAIGAALRGESEPIRAYGVLLNDATLKQRAMTLGLYDGTGALDQQAKVLAAQAEIFAQTSDAQGDFERTSDGLANQQKILAAELENVKIAVGEGVLPVATTLVSTLGDVAGAFNSLDPAVKEGAGTFATYGTAALGIVGTLSFAGGQAIKFRNNLTTVGEDGTRSLNKMGRAAQGASIAIAGLTAISLAETAFDAFNDTAAKTERTLNDVIAVTLDYESTNAEVLQSIGEQADAHKGLAGTIQGYTKHLSLTGATGDEFSITLGENKVAADDLREALDELGNTEVAERALEALKELLGTLEEGSIEYKLLSGEVERFEKNLTSQTAAQAALEKQSVKTADEMEGVGDAVADTAKKVETLKEKFEDYYGLLDSSDALLDAQDQFADLEQAAVDAAEAQEEGGGKAEQANRDMARAINDTKREVIDYATAVGDIPEEALTEILLDLDKGDLAAAEAKFEELTRTRTAIIRIQQQYGKEIAVAQAQTVQSESRFGRAHGGPVDAGYGYKINETGDEVFVPNSDGFVYPASKVKDQAEGGGSVTYKTLNLGGITIVGDAEQKMNEVAAWYQSWAR